MTAAEEGVLLLCCRLGDDTVKPLTMAQFRDLGLRVRASEPAGDLLSDLTHKDLTRLGYPDEQAQRILLLLDRQDRLSDYLAAAERLGIYPITRVSAAYPKRIARSLRFSSTPVLFAKGDVRLLDAPSVAVVGSRQLHDANKAFAAAAGRQAAEEGLTVVSGNASGADQTAQSSALRHGGSCVIFTADRLQDHPAEERTLLISEDGYELPFSPARALHRNRLIHIQGDKTIAAQCTYGKGGTWEGCIDNLKHNWSPLFVFDDGSRGADALMERGAVGVQALKKIGDLTLRQLSMF